MCALDYRMTECQDVLHRQSTRAGLKWLGNKLFLRVLLNSNENFEMKRKEEN